MTTADPPGEGEEGQLAELPEVPEAAQTLQPTRSPPMGAGVPPAAIESLSEVARGAGLPLEGLRMIFRERSLWGLAAVPFGLSLLAVTSAGALLFWNAAALYELVAGWLPAIEADAWYSWLWVGPARAALWLVARLLFTLAAGVSLVAAMLFATLVSSPFQDALSQRVENLVRGSDAEQEVVSWSAVVGAGWRGFAAEAQRLSFFFAVWAVLVGFGLVFPVAHVLTSPLLIVFTVLFLPLEYAGFSLDRRGISFAARRRWLFSHLPSTAGFGAAAFSTLLVPGLNFLMLPALVVAGTLLVVRQEPS